MSIYLMLIDEDQVRGFQGFMGLRQNGIIDRETLVELEYFFKDDSGQWDFVTAVFPDNWNPIYNEVA